jgi:hypothetical protein
MLYLFVQVIMAINILFGRIKSWSFFFPTQVHRTTQNTHSTQMEGGADDQQQPVDALLNGVHLNGDDGSDIDELIAIEEKLVRENSQRIRAMLLEAGEFHSSCQSAFNKEAQGSNFKIQEPSQLLNALNHICKEYKLEEVVEEEVDDLFLSNLQFTEFHMMAKCYFDALGKALDMDKDVETVRF